MRVAGAAKVVWTVGQAQVECRGWWVVPLVMVVGIAGAIGAPMVVRVVVVV